MKPEERLVRDIKNGDRAAMRRLYDLYSGYVMAVVMRYVPDRDDVPDVVQDAFIKIFTSIGQYEYRGEGTLKMWLSRGWPMELALSMRKFKGRAPREYDIIIQQEKRKSKHVHSDP